MLQPQKSSGRIVKSPRESFNRFNKPNIPSPSAIQIKSHAKTLSVEPAYLPSKKECTDQ